LTISFSETEKGGLSPLFPSLFSLQCAFFLHQAGVFRRLPSFVLKRFSRHIRWSSPPLRRCLRLHRRSTPSSPHATRTRTPRVRTHYRSPFQCAGPPVRKHLRVPKQWPLHLLR